MRAPILAAAALAASAAPAWAWQGSTAWATAEALEAARAAAPIVLVAFVDSARQPRGASGVCPADGRVAAVERERGRAFGDRVSVGVPCATTPRADRGPRRLRRVPMAHMRSGSWARIWLDGEGRLVDYQPLRLTPAPPPRHWPATR